MRRVLFPFAEDPCNATCQECSCSITLADIELIQSCEDAGPTEFYTQVSGTYSLTFPTEGAGCCPEGEDLTILLVLNYTLADETTGTSEVVIPGPIVTDGTPTALPLYPDVEWTLEGSCQEIIAFTLTAYVGCGGGAEPSFCSDNWQQGNCDCGMSASVNDVTFDATDITVDGEASISFPPGQSEEECCGAEDINFVYSLTYIDDSGSHFIEILGPTITSDIGQNFVATFPAVVDGTISSWYLEIWFLCGYGVGYTDYAKCSVAVASY